MLLLKNCEPKLSYIPAELFIMCLQVSSLVPVFKNVGKKFVAKKYGLFNLLFMVSKVFEKLVNNRLVDHLEKYGLFSDFRSSRSTEDLLTVVSVALLGLLMGLKLLELWHLIYIQGFR